jgi:hypothetical protein
MSDVSIWAEHGGLIGMIIFALFAAIITMVIQQSKKDKENTQFIQSIIDNEREDKKIEQQLHFKSYERLADAIDRLSNKFD